MNKDERIKSVHKEWKYTNMQLSRSYIEAVPILLGSYIDNNTDTVLIHVGINNIINSDSNISRLLLNIKDITFIYTHKVAP